MLSSLQTVIAKTTGDYKIYITKYSYNCIIHTSSCLIKCDTTFLCMFLHFLMIHITTVIVLSLLYSICGALHVECKEFIACLFLSRSYFLFCATTLLPSNVCIPNLHTLTNLVHSSYGLEHHLSYRTIQYTV